MPDIKTALKEALSEWDDSVGRHQVEKQQPTPLPEVTQMQPINTRPTPRGQRPHPENELLRQAIFDHIKGNPESCVQDLLDCGFGDKTSHFLSEMYEKGKLNRGTQRALRRIRGGHISERDVFTYTVAVKEYDDEPTHIPKRVIQKRVHKKVKHAAQPAQGIAALPTEIKPAQGILRSEVYTPQPETAKPIPANITAAYVLDNISLSEAVLLHAELKKMLG